MGWTPPQTEERLFQSRSNGQSYRILVWQPAVPAPPEGFPAILLLDATGCFGTCVEAVKRMARRPDATGVQQAIVIGVTHPDDTLYDTGQRQRDFTTPNPAVDGSGGAPDFLAFLADELTPSLAADRPLDRNRLTLFGHSLAGFFTLWALAARPDAFAAYAAISPSLWWDRDRLFAALAKADLRQKRLLLCVGEWEAALPPWQRGKDGADAILARRQQRRMIANAEELVRAIRPRMPEGGLDFEVLAQEDHASIVSAAVPRALRLMSARA